MRGIGCLSTRNIINNFFKSYNIALFVAIEPLMEANKISKITKMTCFNNFFSNSNNKVWLLTNQFINLYVLEYFNQVINFKISSVDFNSYGLAVYVAYT